MYDFSDPAFGNQLQGVDGFQSYFYYLGYNGATGANDPCATGFSSLNGYIAMQQPLEAGTNYRLSVNAKTTNSFYLLGFYYGTFPSAQSGTVIDNSVMIDSTGLTDPGNDYVSSTFTVDTDGVYWVIVKNQSGGSVILDNFTLERETVSAPLASFTLTSQSSGATVSELTIAPGESSGFCLSPDEAPTEPVEVIIEITGNTAPHFSGYTPDTLYFPAGDTTAQCFTLAAGNDTTAASYSFAALASGEGLLAFTVNVEAPVCENIAGPDRTICRGDTVQLGIACLPAPHPVDSLEYCYHWEPATGLYSPQDTFPLAFPDETTTYTVYVTTSDGELIAEDSVVVTVEDFVAEILPAAPSLCYREPVTLRQGSMANACENDFVTLSLSGSYASAIWSTGSTADSITVFDPGLYAVTVTSANGCEAVDEVEVEMCTATPLDITASIPQLCEDTVTLSVDTAFMAYTWSDGSGLSALQVVDTGTYSVTVEDENGCMGVDSVTIGVCNAVVDISIYNGFYDWVSDTDWSGGQEIEDSLEYRKGAITLANLNDTDGDEIPDVQDTNVVASQIGRNEIDLMRLDIPNPLQGGNLALKLKVLEGADKVAFWTQPFKGSQLTGMNGEYTVDFEGENSKTFYLEAVTYSEGRIDIVIEASYAGSADTVTATAYWVLRDSVHLSTPTMQQVATPLATYTGDAQADLSCIISNPPFPSPLVVIDQPAFYNQINCRRIANNGTRYGFGPNYRAGLPAQSTANCQTNSYPGDSTSVNPPNKKIGARIFWEFKIKPTLSPQVYYTYGIRFDVTRQKSVNTTEMISGEGQFLPSAKSPDYFPWEDPVDPTDNERANDDEGANTFALQNDNTPNADSEIYSFDPPGIDLYEVCQYGLAFKVFRASFKEFVRVRIGDFKTNMVADSSNVLEGSRASYKEDWYTVFHARRSSTDLYVMSLDTDNVSVSIPFKVSNTPENGSVTLNIVDSTAASVSTNGYRLEYRDSTSTWNVARMVGGIPVTDLDITVDPNDEKKWSAIFEGVVIAITENANVQFQDGHTYTYSTFKTQNPQGKVNGMGLGSPPFNILNTPN